MPASIGVNLRVTGHCRQGGRKYMEDFFTVAYQETEDERDLEYAFFGIYDGHGGAEAAAFAKEHLMETIIKHKAFWSDNDEDVLRAIKSGYIATHYAMWREQEKWPKTASGLPSTAGTTASVAFIRRGKIYIGHVGDSGIVLGYQEAGCPGWKAKPLTRDHKPENMEEMQRIQECGGKVVAKSGVPRVVWNRPKVGHQGPVRRSTPIDEIPFLAVARSLGDLWSYNSQINQFIVSPDPDCIVVPIDTTTHRCLIFGTDGLFNMLSPQHAVHLVQQAERHNEHAALSDSAPAQKSWVNPSKLLVEKALERWLTTKMRADNTSVVTLMLDPPGPPRAQVLKDRKQQNNANTAAYPDSGLEIMMTRYDLEKCDDVEEESQSSAPPTNSDVTPTPVTTSSDISPLKERNYASCKPRESTSYDVRETTDITEQGDESYKDKENQMTNKDTDGSVDGGEREETSDSASDTASSIQINEISSSSSDHDDVKTGDVTTTSSNRKHTLRSSSKIKMDAAVVCSDVVTVTVTRKSARHSNKPTNSDVTAATSTKLRLAQRILRTKKIYMKKEIGQVTKRKVLLNSRRNNNNNNNNVLAVKKDCKKRVLRSEVSSSSSTSAASSSCYQKITRSGVKSLLANKRTDISITRSRACKKK